MSANCLAMSHFSQQLAAAWPQSDQQLQLQVFGACNLSRTYLAHHELESTTIRCSRTGNAPRFLVCCPRGQRKYPKVTAAAQQLNSRPCGAACRPAVFARPLRTPLPLPHNLKQRLCASPPGIRTQSMSAASTGGML